MAHSEFGGLPRVTDIYRQFNETNADYLERLQGMRSKNQTEEKLIQGEIARLEKAVAEGKGSQSAY